MRRDDRLIKLSREHHKALKLARRLSHIEGHSVPNEVEREVEIARPELLAHFQDEEANLLPYLQSHGEQSLVDRLLEEHQLLIMLSSDSRDLERLRNFGQLLTDHVWFEERELFEALQKHWKHDATILTDEGAER